MMSAEFLRSHFLPTSNNDDVASSETPNRTEPNLVSVLFLLSLSNQARSNQNQSRSLPPPSTNLPPQLSLYPPPWDQTTINQPSNGDQKSSINSDLQHRHPYPHTAPRSRLIDSIAHSIKIIKGVPGTKQSRGITLKKRSPLLNPFTGNAPFYRLIHFGYQL